jgi:hypothetical protein
VSLGPIALCGGHVFRREVCCFLVFPLLSVFIYACFGSAQDFSPDVLLLFGFSEILYRVFHWGFVLWFLSILAGLYFI